MAAPRKSEVRHVYGYRTTKKINAKVKEAAKAAGDITHSKWVEIAVTEKLKRDGYMPAEKGGAL